MYNCLDCQYQTPVKCNYQKHIQTKKHQTRKNVDQQKNEYFESFVLRPNSITVQFSIDKGDYWVLSRETYQTEENYPSQTNFSHSKVLVNFNGIEDMIDRTRFILNKEF